MKAALLDGYLVAREIGEFAADPTIELLPACKDADMTVILSDSSRYILVERHILIGTHKACVPGKYDAVKAIRFETARHMKNYLI
jgi:hypothetical protein